MNILKIKKENIINKEKIKSDKPIVLILEEVKELKK